MNLCMVAHFDSPQYFQWYVALEKYAKKLLEKDYAYADTKTEEELDLLRKKAEEEKKPFLYREHRPENPPKWEQGKPLRFKIKELKRTTWNDLVRGELSAGPEALVIRPLPGSGKPGWIVQAYADGTVGLHPLAGVNTEVAAGSTLQFWTKRNNVEGPVSLGLMTPAGATHVSLGKLPLPVDGQIFELTLEPAGGSTVGHPTGPVLFKGLSATLVNSTS